MNRFHRFPIFFAPDTDGASPAPADVGTGDISVPMVATPERTVHEVTLPDTGIENAPILKDLPKETRKVRGPTDFGMPSAEESSEEMGLTPKRERGPDGKFLPKGPKQPESSPSTQQPKAKATTPPAAQKPTPTAQPVKVASQTATAAPVAPAKVKIGGEEKTAAEWEAEIAALKAGKPQDLPPAAKVPEVATKTAEETAAEQKQREDAFLSKAAEGYVIPDAELDEILVGGAKGAAKLASLLAKSEMNGRQFAADQVNEIAKHYDSILSPILAQNQTVQGLMQEAAFLGAHPDIKSNPKGLETFREMKTTMESGYQAIQSKLSAGTATRSEQAWGMLYEDMTPEQRMESIAEHTRAKLATIMPSPVATPAPAKPAPQQVKPNPANVEKPLGGDRPGGGSATPNAETAEQRIRREVNASKGINV